MNPLRDRVQRWLYRRTAVIHDPGLWCRRNPRLTRWLDVGYERSWPLRREVSDWWSVVQDSAKVDAIREVYGIPDNIEVKYWKYDGSASDIRRAGGGA